MNKFEPTKISSIKKIWKDEGFSLKKGLSQNFLIDQNIVDKIISSAEVTSGDTVLEIGPGSGALTASLLEKGATVYAIELDSIASNILKKYLGHNKNFHLINDDILKIDLSFLPHGTKIVSNLPYHITSPIIAKLAESANTLGKIIIMIQKEMADRILAKAPSKNRSSFSVFTSYYFDKKALFTVKPGCFTPRPKVDSVILSLVPKKALAYENPDNYFKFIRTAFSQKRKMIASIIKNNNISEILEKIGCNKNARAEELSESEFMKLYNLFSSSR